MRAERVRVRTEVLVVVEAEHEAAVCADDVEQRRDSRVPVRDAHARADEREEPHERLARVVHVVLPLREQRREARLEALRGRDVLVVSCAGFFDVRYLA